MYQTPAMIEGEEPSLEEMRYLVWLPEGYGEDPIEERPLIFFLHGAGDEDNDSAYVMTYGLPAVLHLGEQPEPFPFIVVSPQAPPGRAWWTEDTLLILSGLLDEVLETYSVDEDRIYLTGLSMGGYGSWHMATAYPDRFAAMVSISGSGYQTAFIPDTNVLCRMEDLPVWAIHGAEDQISAPDASRTFTLALQTCNEQARWTLYQDLGHFGAYERAYRDPELYQWLLDQHRGGG